MVAVPYNIIYAKKIDTGTELTPLSFPSRGHYGYGTSTVIVDENGIEHFLAPFTASGIIDITISTV